MKNKINIVLVVLLTVMTSVTIILTEVFFCYRKS